MTVLFFLLLFFRKKKKKSWHYLNFFFLPSNLLIPDFLRKTSPMASPSAKFLSPDNEAINISIAFV